MGDIRVGTASWADKKLVESGLFYPPEAKSSEARLQYYASQFDCVEVDSTYYAIPDERNGYLWAERTPDNFTFDVKAFRLFTGHWTEQKVLPKDVTSALPDDVKEKKRLYYEDFPEELRKDLWNRFAVALRPLVDAGKMGAVLLQFPPWFIANRYNSEHIQHCAEMLDGHTVVVEFRHRSWFSERARSRTIAGLKENGLALAIADEPQGFDSSVPLLPVVTSPHLAYVRFHGRNAETWEKTGLSSSTERFDYLYSDEELQSFIPSLRQLAGEAREVRAYFNNNQQDYAQRNAAQIKRLIDA